MGTCFSLAAPWKSGASAPRKRNGSTSALAPVYRSPKMKFKIKKVRHPTAQIRPTHAMLASCSSGPHPPK
jgi:hypothetical protein